MKLEELEKFCGSYREFTRKPFSIDKWRVATDGYTLVAENGFSPIKLPELEPSANRDYIVRMLATEIPKERYSLDHLSGFLGDDDKAECEPIFFNGNYIDKTKLRKVFSFCDEPFGFKVTSQDGGCHCFNFQFAKVIALIMGMKNPRGTEPRYEPKPLNKVSI